jgi:hypothetical protein
MAAHAPRFATLDLPRPVRSAAPLLALALVALAFEADRGLRLAGLAAFCCFALAAVVRAGRARRELAIVRRAADRLIVTDPRGGEVSELIQWRSHELVDPEQRAALRRELERTIRRLDPAHLPSSSPLRRAALRRHEDLLHTISPLYGEGEEPLARTLSRVRGALDP